MTPETLDLYLQALRALFLILVPLIIGVCVGGIVSSVLQALTFLNDQSISYASRLIALALVLYSFSGTFSQSLVGLMERALR